MSNLVNMKQLLEAGVHYGHQTRRWNPKMGPYIYGERNGIHIIDLQKTVKKFQAATAFLESVTSKRGHVLFVGTKRLARDLVKEEASRAGMYFINHRWLGGTLTNFQTIRQSIHRLKRIERMEKDGTFQKLTKKEVLGLTRELEKLERNLGGIKDMPGLPRALFVVDAHKETIAILEATKLGIPVVAITDTNADPNTVEYPVPGNDDSIKSLQLFISTAAEACLAGKRKSQQFEGEDDEGGVAVKEGSFRDDKGNKVAIEKKN
jgi:small subunit ribosomal protein S2